MRKIWLDIGLHRGQTLELAIKQCPEFDLYVGVEPLDAMMQKATELLQPYTTTKRVLLYNIALDKLPDPTQIIDQTFYEDCRRGSNKLGSTLYSDKLPPQFRKELPVMCMDIRTFFQDILQVQPDDQITLKMDVEGKEYDLFDALIESGWIKQVTKIYSEWHWNKVPSITKERHNEILIKLNKLGYNLKGKSREDEFYKGL